MHAAAPRGRAGPPRIGDRASGRSGPCDEAVERLDAGTRADAPLTSTGHAHRKESRTPDGSPASPPWSGPPRTPRCSCRTGGRWRSSSRSCSASSWPPSTRPSSAPRCPRSSATSAARNELYTWVVTIYLLTGTITGVFYGKLSDIYGRRPMLLIGISIFLLGSACRGLSWSMESLILFRGIQGVGAGAIFPISLAVIGDLFTPAERGKYQGLFGAVFGVVGDPRPAAGRLADRQRQLALDLLRQPAHRRRDPVHHLSLPAHARTASGRTRNLDYLGAAVFTVAVSLPAASA